MMWLMMMLACASVKGRSNTPLHFGFNIPHHTTTQPNALCLHGRGEIESNHWNLSPVLLAPIALRWNYDWDSKTTAFSFFLWWPAKQTGRTWSHKLLKFFHRDIRREKIGTSEPERKLHIFSLLLLVCTQVSADKWWFWQKRSFQQQHTRSCVGEIFFSMLPGAANVVPGYFSNKKWWHKAQRENYPSWYTLYILQS